MERTKREDYSYKFEKIQIFKDQQLGHGAYGAVYKAKCDTLPCAAKLIYPVLFGQDTSLQQVPSQGKEHRLPLQRFEAECRFLSLIKHPNIVQYLGTYHDPETNVPVLLMELMDESLTHFLETPHNAVLFHTQVNILHDTALALAFLHTNGILHRDLSSNNVLLIAGSRAKVTDFGMSTLTEYAHVASLTQTPGTPVYMPPEALSKPPKYSEKLDCFSFGVLTVQAITREFPQPTDQLQAKEMFDSEGKKARVYVQISELERRQSHISLIPAAHPLRPIALDCLKDNDIERPTAQQLCERLEELKSTPLYASSIGQIRDRDLLVQSQGETTCDKEKQMPDQQQIIQDLQQTIREKEQEITLLKEENQQLQRQIDQPPQDTIEKPKPDHQRKQPFKLMWTKSPNNAPSTMKRGSCTVLGNTLYINSLKVYEFQCGILKWTTSFKISYTNSTLTTINETLTTVGGIDYLYNCNNKLITFNGQRWLELYPPMPTARSHTSVLSTTTHVVVIGGKKNGELLNTTEILNIETKVWSVASPLPYCTSLATIALCKGTIYLMGGATDTEFNYILSCQLTYLVEHSVPVKKWSFTTTQCKYNLWLRLPDPPVRLSTCVTVEDHLLAIGGTCAIDNLRSNVIYRYDQKRNQWVVISNLATARSACLATVLPGNNLFVVGGITGIGQETDETEIASIDNI